MKNLLYLFFLMHCSAYAQGDSLYVSGRFLFNKNNEKIILKGINYSVLDDWSFPSNMNNGNERLSEIEKTKANTVRIQWYNDYGQPTRPTYNLTHLDSLLTRCARYKMIPIVGLWDVTCGNDWATFATRITNWYTQPAVINLFNKHKRYSVINLANEFGYYNYVGGTTAALNTYKNNYKTIITTIRNAGYKQPIMIDAPDCGTNPDVLIAVGNELLTHDPLHNIIFSVHSYWISITGNDATAIANKVQLMVNSNLPFVFGEISNYQSDATACQYVLNYQALLNNLQTQQIGWLAWNWQYDACANREMTSTGLFNNLGTFGLDITNNSTYGLANTAIRLNSTFGNATVLATTALQLHINCNTGNNIGLKIDFNNIPLQQNIILQTSTDNGATWQTQQQFTHSSIDGSIVINNVNITAATIFRAALTNGSRLSNVVSCNTTNSNTKIYPNPVNQQIKIETNSIGWATLINSNGKTVLQKAITFNNSIDVSHQPNGWYILKIWHQQNNSFSYHKIIIAH